MSSVMLVKLGCLSRTCVSISTARAALHTGDMHLKSNRIKLANMMGKVMNLKGKKRKWVNYNPAGSSDGIRMVIDDPSHKRDMPRRVSVLNKLFMDHISDIIANGSVSTDLSDRGLEITRVSVSREFNYMNVFWAASNSEDDQYLQKTLPDLAFSLRHELTQMQLMGTVPRIVFIRDVDALRHASIQSLLDVCDKGPEEDEEPTEEAVDEIPPMPMNVYGLKYDEMVSKLMKAVVAARAPHRNKVNDVQTQKINPSSPDDLSIVDDREAIRQFFKQKKIERRKVLKAENKREDELIEGYV